MPHDKNLFAYLWLGERHLGPTNSKSWHFGQVPSFARGRKLSFSFFMWWLGHGGWQVKTSFSSKAGYNWEESIEVISVCAGNVTAPLLPTARFYSLPCNSFISNVIGKFNSCSNLF